MNDLRERTALVTGGSSGIGLAATRLLLEAGARVLVVDVARPPEGLGAAFAETDVSRAADWERVMAAVDSQLGGLDYAFLNAGIAVGELDVTKVSLEDTRRILGVNIDGVVLGTRAVIPAMRQRGGGSIVATASLAGLISFSPDPLYTLTKHAVVGWVRAMAAPLTEDGITINAICPGLTDTPIVDAVARGGLETARFPLMAPEQVAQAALDRFTGSETGTAWVCQHGRDPVQFRFGGVPGPGGGQRPPKGIGDPSATG